MARGRQVARERTEAWNQIQQNSLWSEQVEYELIRNCVLFNESAAERARETGIPARTISRHVKRFRDAARQRSEPRPWLDGERPSTTSLASDSPR